LIYGIIVNYPLFQKLFKFMYNVGNQRNNTDK